MRNIIRDFFGKGCVASGFGPLVLAVLYLILQKQCNLQSLTVSQVCTGIVSLWLLAFLVGGMNVVYRIERLPLMLAILIHGVVLYICYLGTYLINGWLERGRIPILVFTGIFGFGYLLIWAVIYFISRKRTARLNEKLKRNQN